MAKMTMGMETANQYMSLTMSLNIKLCFRTSAKHQPTITNQH